MFNIKLLFLWIKDNKYGFINFEYKEIIPCIYDSTSKMINDKVWLLKNNEWAFYDYKYNKVINKRYSNLIDYNGLYSIVENNNKYYLIDHLNEHQTTLFEKDIVPISINENNYIKFTKNNLYGFMDTNLKIIIEPIYLKANDFINNYCSVNKDNKWGLIDNNNNLIIDYKYDYMSNDCSGFIKVIENNNEYFIDKKENKYLYDFNKNYKFYEFSELLLPFEYKNKKGYMNQFFEVEYLKKIDEINNFNNDFAIIKVKNYYGVINKKFKWVLKPIYKKIIEFDGYSFFVIDKNNNYDHISINGNSLLKK